MCHLGHHGERPIYSSYLPLLPVVSSTSSISSVLVSSGSSLSLFQFIGPRRPLGSVVSSRRPANIDNLIPQDAIERVALTSYDWDNINVQEEEYEISTIVLVSPTLLRILLDHLEIDSIDWDNINIEPQNEREHPIYIY